MPLGQAITSISSFEVFRDCPSRLGIGREKTRRATFDTMMLLVCPLHGLQGWRLGRADVSWTNHLKNSIREAPG